MEYEAPLSEELEFSALDVFLSNDQDGEDDDDSTNDRDNRLFRPKSKEILYLKAAAEFNRLHKASLKQTSLEHLQIISKFGKTYPRPFFEQKKGFLDQTDDQRTCEDE